MSLIEIKKGVLKAIDDGAKIVKIELDSNVIPVHRFDEPITPNITPYPYAENIEWKDTNLLNKLGKKVEIQLVDGVVDKITLL